jgi:hypothetical protein
MPTSIISASRRTDIPAYYSEWFMNRVREGTVTWNNPYNGMEMYSCCGDNLVQGQIQKVTGIFGCCTD